MDHLRIIESSSLLRLPGVSACPGGRGAIVAGEQRRLLSKVGDGVGSDVLEERDDGLGGLDPKLLS